MSARERESTEWNVQGGIIKLVTKAVRKYVQRSDVHECEGEHRERMRSDNSVLCVKGRKGEWE